MMSLCGPWEQFILTWGEARDRGYQWVVFGGGQRDGHGFNDWTAYFVMTVESAQVIAAMKGESFGALNIHAWPGFDDELMRQEKKIQWGRVEE